MIPERSNTEACTKISLPPRSGAMKPKPLLALYHFTVPISSTVVRSAAGWYAGRSSLGRLGCSCVAVLASTPRISVTCGPFEPGPARTSSVAPGGTLPWPPRSTTLTWRNASPEPSASSTKPKPLSGLYHLTVARTDGPEGLSNCGPRGGAYPKLRVGGWWLSSPKSRRRLGRKSRSRLFTAALPSQLCGATRWTIPFAPCQRQTFFNDEVGRSYRVVVTRRPMPRRLAPSVASILARHVAIGLSP